MPASAAAVQSASSIGMSVSAPSRLNRFCPRYLVCRKRSNASAALSRSRMRRFSVGVGLGVPGTSTCSWIHSFWSGSWMCMYSTPTVRAYASRSTPRMSRSGMRRALEAARAEAADRELAVEVPDREAVVRDVELGMRGRLAPAERVEVGDEVAAHPVHVDERGGPARPSRAASAGSANALRSRAPPRRLVRHARGSRNTSS